MAPNAGSGSSVRGDGARGFFLEEREGVAVPRRLPLLVAAGLLLIVGFLWRPVAPACVAGSGALLTVAAARDNRFLLGAALLGFGARVLLAVTFHWAAVLDLSALHALQTRPIAGYRFWVLALDASGYHDNAVAAVASWQQGTEFPRDAGTEYFIFTAVIYRLFGSNPLNAVLWNALFGSLTVVAGYRIAARLAGLSAARPAAVLIALWPSAVLWSSQLLKDTLCLWLTLVPLYLTMRVVEPAPLAAARWRAFARWAGLLLLVFVAVVMMHRFRYQVLHMLIPAPALFVVHALVRRSRQTPWRIVAACTVIGVMFLAVSASRRIDLESVFAPRHPEIGHVNLGVLSQVRGDLNAAQAHYERALVLVKDYPPALKQLGTVALARNDRAKAVTYFDRYLAREPKDERVRSALATLRPPISVAAVQGTLVQPPAVARLSPPDSEVAGKKPTPLTEPVPPEVPPLLALTPTPLPEPPTSFAITGRTSDYMTGQRAWLDGDVLAALQKARGGFSGSGGHSLIDADVEFRGYWDVLRYIPRAVVHVLLSPYPWQWFDIGGGTGPFKALSAVEALLLYALIVPLIAGLGAAVWRGSPDALYLAAFVVGETVALGLVVSNLGTLFRLRLESLLPLFTAAGLAWAWLFHRRERRS